MINVAVFVIAKSTPTNAIQTTQRKWRRIVIDALALFLLHTILKKVSRIDHMSLSTVNLHHRIPIKVAHFHSVTGVYGAERWTATQMQNLDRNVVDAMVITIGNKPGAASFHEFMRARGHTSIHLPIAGKLNPKAIIALRRLLMDEHIDIVHTHGLKSDVLGYLATRGLPIHLVATPHGWSAHESLRIRAYESISRLFLRRFDRIYPLSPSLEEDLIRRGFKGNRLRLILNAVNASTFDRCFNNRRIRKSGDPFHILFVGRLCRPKGVFELLEAIAQAWFDCPIEVRLVGDGACRQQLEDYTRALGIANKVHFIGAVNQVLSHFEWSDVLVLPSHSEGIPRVIMEAFAAGVPVIGTAIPGIQQLVEEDSTGTLVPLRNSDALVKALIRISEHPDNARRMAINARNVVLEKFSASRQAREFEAEYIQLITAPLGHLAAQPSVYGNSD